MLSAASEKLPDKTHAEKVMDEFLKFVTFFLFC